MSRDKTSPFFRTTLLEFLHSCNFYVLTKYLHPALAFVQYELNCYLLFATFSRNCNFSLLLLFMEMHFNNHLFCSMFSIPPPPPPLFPEDVSTSPSCCSILGLVPASLPLIYFHCLLCLSCSVHQLSSLKGWYYQQHRMWSHLHGPLVAPS